MSLGNREGGADEDAEPEDLPNLVRRSTVPPWGERRAPLHPAMDRTADFFRVRKSRLLRRGFCMHTMLCEVGRSCIWGSTE